MVQSKPLGLTALWFALCISTTALVRIPRIDMIQRLKRISTLERSSHNIRKYRPSTFVMMARKVHQKSGGTKGAKNTRGRLSQSSNRATSISKGKSPQSSNSVPIVPLSRSEDNFLLLMREYRKASSLKKILSSVKEHSDNGYLTQNMTLVAMKTLQRINRTEVMKEIVPYWLKLIDDIKLQKPGDRAVELSPAGDDTGTASSPANIETDAVTAAVRLYCKLQMMDAAVAVAGSVGVCVDAKKEDVWLKQQQESLQANSSPAGTSILSSDTLEFQRRLLPDLSLGFITTGAQFKSLTALDMLKNRQLGIDKDVSRLIFKQFLAQSKPDMIRRALRALLAVRGLDDNDSIQLITNSFLRSVDFVKGAVSVETLPEALYPEIAFIGRSNVGKSSLINMVTNRKGLAYTSKTPGKTSEFNYFDAQGVVGVEKEAHRFYLVDLPGVGYARATKELRQSWTNLLKAYVSERDTLRTIFHLVDSRHGLLDADAECLSLLSDDLPAQLNYVIVLTKADKQSNAEKLTAALSGIVDNIYREVAKRTTRVVPIILTSSETREGGTLLLSHMLDSVATSSSSSSSSSSSNT